VIIHANKRLKKFIVEDELNKTMKSNYQTNQYWMVKLKKKKTIKKKLCQLGLTH
jgi:hypothetical protein